MGCRLCRGPKACSGGGKAGVVHGYAAHSRATGSTHGGSRTGGLTRSARRQRTHARLRTCWPSSSAPSAAAAASACVPACCRMVAACRSTTHLRALVARTHGATTQPTAASSSHTWASACSLSASISAWQGRGRRGQGVHGPWIPSINTLLSAVGSTPAAGQQQGQQQSCSMAAGGRGGRRWARAGGCSCPALRGSATKQLREHQEQSLKGHAQHRAHA